MSLSCLFKNLYLLVALHWVVFLLFIVRRGDFIRMHLLMDGCVWMFGCFFFFF